MNLLPLSGKKPDPGVARRLAVVAPAFVMAGCTGRANPPSVPLFGSYFPAWMICAIGGVAFAVVLRALLVRTRIDAHLPMPPLVYLCLAISGGIGLWFLWSGLV
jgi:hypothetical protein